MAQDKVAMAAELIDRGMTVEEADNFLASKVGYVKLQLPPDRAAAILTALSEMSLISSPIEVTFAVAENRVQKLGDVAQEASGRQLVNGMITPDTPVC